ncbi:von Willebrand factor type A domain-containing protein [uncultured Lutibacter sp.]|uniref:vWA domain-containing protein n=1 Tax=uncultured Lutibacter sp. TaxID=437739 RepID=UPI00260B064F|nr:von Willebrand factor type A domain-containing protein [uncultured Lutibacter sp.]
MKTYLAILLTLFIKLQINAQEKTITGVVTDGTHPIPGVSVLIKGTSNGAITDFDGKYSISASEGDKLIYSFIGFISKEIKVGTSTIINVILKEDSTCLEEVVLIGYGTQRKSWLAGAVRGVRVRGSRKNRKYNQPINNSNKVSSNDSYKEINENTFKSSQLNPLSTFSIDVDKAAYSNVRRMINNGQTVPKDAVKIEEMINYFNYNYPQSTTEHPFSINTEVAQTPWNEVTKIVKIGLQGKELDKENIPKSNLVFLLDVSGSMSDLNKLPLLKSAFKLLVNQLRETDKVSIVVYAGAAGVVLKPTSGTNKEKILNALNRLEAGGSTAGGEGIELAYKLAEKHFVKGGNNRVVMATDGDFNVGPSGDKAMKDLIVEKRKSGIFLTVLGFGYGNLKDSTLETLADKGNGNYAYIDTMQEANKTFGEEFAGTMYTIAKDVKIQVEFNPNKVEAYRLIGYENRMLNAEDFKDDKKDAGELGCGHTVTALYEIIPVGVKSKYLKNIDNLKYTKTTTSTLNNELLTVKFRYKKPSGKKSIEIIDVVNDENKTIEAMSNDFKFSTAVALFGMKLAKSKFTNKANYNKVIELAKEGKGEDKNGYRSEFIRLVKSYKNSNS